MHLLGTQAYQDWSNRDAVKRRNDMLRKAEELPADAMKFLLGLPELEREINVLSRPAGGTGGYLVGIHAPGMCFHQPWNTLSLLRGETAHALWYYICGVAQICNNMENPGPWKTKPLCSKPSPIQLGYG